jgi:hypothetical protein
LELGDRHFCNWCFEICSYLRYFNELML